MRSRLGKSARSVRFRLSSGDPEISELKHALKDVAVHTSLFSAQAWIEPSIGSGSLYIHIFM